MAAIAGIAIVALLCSSGSVVAAMKYKSMAPSPAPASASPKPSPAPVSQSPTPGPSVTDTRARDIADSIVAVSDVNRGLIPVGQNFYSVNKKFYFVYNTDGNVVVYNSANTPLWYSNNNIGATSLKMQEDGNLVVFKNTQVMWSSNKVLPVSGAPYSLVMADNGVAEVRDKTGALSYGLNPVPAV